MRRVGPLVVALLCASAAGAQERGEAYGGLRLFAQPASGDWLIVATPSVNGSVNATPWLGFDVSWLADVVTGATPRTYGRPDVITAATQFSETRNVIGGGVRATFGPAILNAGYSYGTESDYRSQLLVVGARFDLNQHNTVIATNYGHSWNSICDLSQANVPLLLRQPLDSSRGCFADTPTLTEESLNTDALDLSIVQTLTPNVIGALVGSYEHLNGFQSSPYRRVRLFEGDLQPQESEPLVRDRGSVTARVRWAIARFRATLGFDLRLYGDTWGVQSITGEATWQQPFRRDAPAWSFIAHARGYIQSGASFYRDAGNPNSYEIAGPVGNYFTADQELAPLADLIVGLRVIYRATAPPDKRIGRMFTDGQLSFFFDYMKTFALTPDPPNVARTTGLLSGLVSGFSATGKF